MNQSLRGKQKRAKSPAEAFKQCPACESPNLIKFEGDALCSYCGWDSIALRVEARFAARQFQEPGTIESISAREDAAAEQAQELILGSPFLRNQPSVA